MPEEIEAEIEDVLLKVVRAGDKGVDVTMNLQYNELFSIIIKLVESLAETAGIPYNEVLENMTEKSSEDK